MNSLQLVSKIRSKADDLSQNISDLLMATHSFSELDKELLKKQCLDLYELVLKLKSENTESTEKPVAKINAPAITPVAISTPAPTPLPQEIVIEETLVQAEPEIVAEEEPVVQASNFKEVLTYADQSNETLNDLLAKVEITEEEEEEVIPASPEPEIEPVQEKPEPLNSHIGHEVHPHHIDFNIGKVVENKRIQYTVMPDLDEPKPTPLNATFKDKEPSYNDRIAQINPPVTIPLAEKTIEAPIDSMKSAINLNKKIAFVNELFKENVVEYAKAIDRLNNATDLNDAYRIHNELKHQYLWDNSHELVQDLERLIRRRFS